MRLKGVSVVKRLRIFYNERMYECRYVYSNRKTVSIRVVDALTVEVRAPKALPRGDVRDFVARSSDWIARQVAARRMDEARAAEYRYGRVLIDGEDYAVVPSRQKRAALTELGLTVSASGDVRASILSYLKRRAAIELPAACAAAAQNFGYPAVETAITSATTQWGNCNGRRIRLHYALICVPERLRDYVILHELTHLEHLDHSPAFWTALKNKMPDARARRAELKTYAWLLKLYRPQ